MFVSRNEKSESGKRGGVNKGEEGVATLTAEQSGIVRECKIVQSEHRKLTLQYEAEWNVLKARYEKLYMPLYTQRAQLLQRKISDGHTLPPNVRADGGLIGTPGISNFWLIAMTNNRAMCDLIEVYDRPILSYLQNITYEWYDEVKQDGFTLSFHFADNPFFTQKVLEKTYKMHIPEGEDEAILYSTNSTAIEWKNETNVTKKTITRKQRNRKTRQIRTITETVENASFFNFFSNYYVPSEEQLLGMSDNEVVELELTIEADYEVGVLIRERIIPQAILWFCGEIDDEDVGDYVEDEEEEEDDVEEVEQEGDFDFEDDDDNDNDGDNHFDNK